MNTCPFCRGVAVTTHTPQDCLAHVRQRLREMTERRDALQVSLNAERRKVEKIRVRAHARIAAVKQECDRWRSDATKQRAISRKAIQFMRKFSTDCERFLEV